MFVMFTTFVVFLACPGEACSFSSMMTRSSPPDPNSLDPRPRSRTLGFQLFGFRGSRSALNQVERRSPRNCRCSRRSPRSSWLVCTVDFSATHSFSLFAWQVWVVQVCFIDSYVHCCMARAGTTAALKLPSAHFWRYIQNIRG